MIDAPKVIAFYLPQFHPIAENSEWWGFGFTEWHNVARARPLFRGHRQPILPGELGFYDLRLAETRENQAALARDHGIHGFCYWHYWFAGRRLLERPAAEMLALGKPDLPFCLGWANETWTGIWHGSPRSVLVEQSYPEGDADAHYAELRRYFHDPRYIRDEGRPLFYIYKPKQIPQGYVDRLRNLARADGFPDLFVLGTWQPNPAGRFDSAIELGLDAAIVTNISGRDSHSSVHLIDAAVRKLLAFLPGEPGPQRIPFKQAMKVMLPELERFGFPAYNTVIPNWDNTPRSGRRGLVLEGSTPASFEILIREAVAKLSARPASHDGGPYIFLKSWNEWAEGNYIEPDQQGRQYLESLRRALQG